VIARRRRLDGLILATLAGVSILLFANVRTLPDYVAGREAPPPSASASAPTGPPVQDFACAFNYARSAAQHRGVSPYSIPEQRRFLTEWLGPHISSSAPFAYGPAAILAWAPLFPLPTAWAWLVWNLIGVTLATAAVRWTARDDRGLLGFGGLALLSPTTFHCLVLGQTALFTSALLAGVVVLARDAKDKRAVYGIAACLVLVSMKPPLAMVAGAALLAAGCWRALLAGSAAILIVVLAAIVWWTTDAVADYGALVSRYNLVEAPALFRAGFHPEFMTNLRNVLLHAGLDDARAAAATWPPLAAGLAVPLLVGLAMRRRPRLDVALAFTATSYALFSPHLTPTEDFVMVMATLWLWPLCDGRARAVLAVSCLAVQFAGGSTFALIHQLGLSTRAGSLPLVAFGAKLAILVVAARTLVATREPRVAVGRALA
jgi:hypothetical protein